MLDTDPYNVGTGDGTWNYRNCGSVAIDGNQGISDGWADTYVFNLGDGKDTIIEWGYESRTDVLRFGAGISASSLVVSRTGTDLVISVSASDQVTIKDWFRADNYEGYSYIEQFQFANGTFGVNPRGGEVERGVPIDAFIERLAADVVAGTVLA